MQKQKKKFFEGHRSTFWIKMQFGIGHPPPTHQLQSTCVGEGSRVPNLQTEFNYLDSFKSYGIFSDFVVPMWSLSSSHRPRCPHVIPVSSMSSPHHLHIIPTLSPSSLSSPEGPHVVSMVCGLHMLSPSSPRRPCHPRVIPVIPTSSRRSPHHAQILRYPLYPPPPPWGVGAPNQ